MDKKLYTAGEFAKKAGVTIRTIRFYDNKGLLKPTCISESGYRLYTDEDFAKLQKILTLKYLGFSLEDIFISILGDEGKEHLKKSLEVQMQIVKNKISHMQLVEKSIIEAQKMIEEESDLDWNKVINIIQVLNMERDLVENYKDATHLKVRISIHEKFGVNKQRWFNWLFNQMNITSDSMILELGCGNGELWKSNRDKLPSSTKLVLTDKSEGMINDARKNLKNLNNHLKFEILDCSTLPFEDESFDVVIANHMLFYVTDRTKAFSEIKRVLKHNGYLYCSTYGMNHMKEVGELAKSFDSRISLAEVNLYEIFGLENGEKQLKPWFNEIEMKLYEDYLLVDDYKPLLDYILSCHGNEHEVLEGHYEEFERYIKAKVEKLGTFKITKQAGLFLCKK